MSKFYPKNSQRGLTLLEVIVSLAIVSSASIGLYAVADQFSNDTKVTVAASQVRAFGDAARAYIKDNYASIQAVATPTTPALIDVPTLIAAGNLTTGFLSTNAYGQSMCALVLEPTANRLQAMVVSEGGQTVDDLSLGSMAAVIGGSGGGTYASDPSTMRGAVGGWAIATATFDNLVNNVNRRCDGTAGNVRVAAGRPAMALWFENGDTSSAFLARDPVPGRPELNQMNTPIVLNSVQTAGGACSSVGAIAQDGAGGILSCQAGLWKAPGDGKCVSTTSDLNNLQTDGRCYNGVALPNSPAGGDWVFVEVYRHINSANYYVAQRVVGMTGVAVGRVWQRNQQSGSQAGGWSAWVQQADPGVSISNGNVTAAGEIFAKRGQFSRDGAGPCCGDTGTLSLAENTWATGRKAGISLHNGGVHEGNIELAGSGARRIRLYDNQGAGMGLDTTGPISTQAENWGLVLRNGAGADNAQPTSGVGSAYVNDIYIRSIGKWASQLGNSKTLVGIGSVSGQDWIYVYPPPGASTATHRIYAYATEYNQCNWEKQHAANWAFEMGDAPQFLQGSRFCPGWSSISYISFAVPH